MPHSGAFEGRTWPSRYELYTTVKPRVAAGWELTTLREPSRLFGSNGIRVHDGRLWIAELVGDQISTWDLSSGDRAVASPMGSLLSGPDDVAFDSEGTVYTAETMNGRVSGRRANGEYFVLLDDCPCANGIYVDPRTDTLYVDEMREGGRILEVDRHRPNTFRVIAEGLDWLNALETGDDGRLYVPQVLDGRVISVDPVTGDVKVAAEGFIFPTAAKFDPSGRLVVSDAGTGIVSAIDPATGERVRLAEPGQGIDSFAFDAAGNLYVSNFIDTRVVRYAAGTERIDQVISERAFMGPYQVAADDGDGYLAADSNSICHVSPAGEISRLSRLFFDQPFVAIGAQRVDGNLVALTQAGDVFRREDGRDTWEKLLGSTGDATTQYLSVEADGASAIAVNQGTLLAGLVDGGVVALAMDGTITSRWETGLASIVAVAGHGDTVVACDEKSATLVLLADGERRVLNGFDAPAAVAVTGEALYVAQRQGGGGRVIRVDLTDLRREVIAEGLPLGLPADGVSYGRRPSLLIDTDHSLVVGCDGDGTIRRLTRRVG
jgi:sugar lactone lactonase YvrE